METFKMAPKTEQIGEGVEICMHYKWEGIPEMGWSKQSAPDCRTSIALIAERVSSARPVSSQQKTDRLLTCLW